MSNERLHCFTGKDLTFLTISIDLDIYVIDGQTTSIIYETAPNHITGILFTNCILQNTYKHQKSLKEARATDKVLSSVNLPQLVAGLVVFVNAPNIFNCKDG